MYGCRLWQWPWACICRGLPGKGRTLPTVRVGGSREARQRLSLAEVHPDLAAEALFDAASVTAGSSKLMPWRCQHGHEWQAAVKNRSRGAGCPVCANKVVVSGFNDLATTHPEVAAEAAFDATTVTAGVSRKMPWRCGAGHEWAATVASRAKGAGCPICSGARALPGFNDLATTHPELVSEALFDTTTVRPGSTETRPWRCARGHEWRMSPHHRTAQGQGCPYCANRRVLPGFNDLATTHPELADEALFDATTVTFGSQKPRLWRCAKGHEWQAPPAGRTISGEGCPVCAGKQVIPGVNDLATTHPDLAAQAEFDATTVTGGSHRKLPWRCGLGHEWTAQVSSRTGPQGRGCPVCAGKTVLPGFNDLATTHPEVAAEALFDPTTVSSGSAKQLPWCCPQGHKWTTTVIRRAHRGDGCPYCSNKRLLVGFNDLATTHPQVAAEARFDASSVVGGNRTRKPWRCSEGHEWSATPKSRTQNGTGCPTCCSHGFNPGEPAWLYLMEHPVWGLLQVGITNDLAQRQRAHQRRGWELLDVRGPMPGDAARRWEVSILGLLSAQGIPLTPSGAQALPSKHGAHIGPVGEAWWLSDYRVNQLGELIEAVREGEWLEC